MATEKQLNDPSKKWTVYMHIFPNGKKYVGITSRKPEDRWFHGRGYRNCIKIKRAIEKYGWENVEHRILFEGLTRSEAEEKEKQLIADMNLRDDRFGYNVASGGLKFDGETDEMRAKSLSHSKNHPHKVSEEYKKKLSIWYSGAGNPFYGKSHTKETREKIAMAHRGKKQTKESIEKRRMSLLLYRATHKEEVEETDKKRMEVLHSQEYIESTRIRSQKFGKKVLCVETGKVYSSIKQAGRETNTDSIGITHCINSPQKYSSAGGFHWKLAE